MNHAIRITCPNCGVGCGVRASVAANGAVEIRGEPDHPANFGGATIGDQTILSDFELFIKSFGIILLFDLAPLKK